MKTYLTHRRDTKFAYRFHETYQSDIIVRGNNSLPFIEAKNSFRRGFVKFYEKTEKKIEKKLISFQGNQFADLLKDNIQETLGIMDKKTPFWNENWHYSIGATMGILMPCIRIELTSALKDNLVIFQNVLRNTIEVMHERIHNPRKKSEPKRWEVLYDWCKKMKVTGLEKRNERHKIAGFFVKP